MNSGKCSKRKGAGGSPRGSWNLHIPSADFHCRTCSTYFPHLGTHKASAQWLFWKQDAIPGKNVPSKVNKHETDRMLCSTNTNHRLLWLLNFLNTRFLSRLFLLSPSFTFIFGSMRLKIYDISCTSVRNKCTSSSLLYLQYLESNLNLCDALLQKHCHPVFDWFYFIMNTHNCYGAHLLSITLAWCIFISRFSKVPPDIKIAGTRSSCPSSKLSLNLFPVSEILH